MFRQTFLPTGRKAGGIYKNAVRKFHQLRSRVLCQIFDAKIDIVIKIVRNVDCPYGARND